jgi:dTDP-4-dehydrorhamnose reductase
VALHHRDLDITDAEAVARTIAALAPKTVFNTAVIGVDACERHPGLARRVNIDGPASLAAACRRARATFVHFSSNYVFDGNSDRPYTTSDEPGPINTYGQTKWEGEKAAAERCARTFIVRTSWVYGGGKSSFLATAPHNLRLGQRVKANGDTWASCTYVEDLVARVLDLVASEPPGTYHVVNEGVCSHETFAREAARLVGVPESIADKLIEVVSEEQMERPAKRPRFTPMVCVPPMRAWQEALADFVSR